MKRKGHRSIPDFSKKQAPRPNAQPSKVKMEAPPPPMRVAKLQATSAKSGQRGR